MAHIGPSILDNDVPEVILCAVPIEQLEKSDDCYHNSRSNRHVFHGRHFFDEYTEIEPVKVHAFSEGLTIAVTGAGSVKLKVSYRGKPKIITLTNCLHMPPAHVNLISQICLDKFGVSTWFDNGTVTLFKDKIPCIDGIIHNDLYRLNMRLIKPETQQDSIVMSMKAFKDVPGFCTA